MVYDTTTGKIVNLAFQHLGPITDGSSQTQTQTTRTVTPPTMTDAIGLSTLTTINFANNSQLQSIGPKAFAGCTNLTSVNLPDSTNTIGSQAFQNCINLQTINLKGVSYIGDAAFNNAFIAQNDALATQNPVSLNLTSAQYIGVGAFDSSVWTSTTTTTTGQTSSTTTNPVQVLPGTVGSSSTTGSTTTTVTVVESQNLSKP